MLFGKETKFSQPINISDKSSTSPISHTESLFIEINELHPRNIPFRFFTFLPLIIFSIPFISIIESHHKNISQKSSAGFNLSNISFFISTK